MVAAEASHQTSLGGRIADSDHVANRNDARKRS